MNKQEHLVLDWIDVTILADCNKYLCLAMNEDGRIFLHVNCTLDNLIAMIFLMGKEHDVMKKGIIRAADMLSEEGGEI